MSVYVQHGVGATPTATTTPERLRFYEEGEYRRARSVSVKNKGTATVLLLVNVSLDDVEMADQFTNLTPVPLESGDAFVFVPEPLSGPALKNVAFKTDSGTANLIIAAY